MEISTISTKLHQDEGEMLEEQRSEWREAQNQLNLSTVHQEGRLKKKDSNRVWA